VDIIGGRQGGIFRYGYFRYSTRLYGPSRTTSWLSWIGDERIAVGSLPTALTMPKLAVEGVTHVVNCRSLGQVRLSQDLAVERSVFGASRVAHAPMVDFGLAQQPRLWSAAAWFAAAALDDDADARVLIHCQQGRRRSVMVAYAVLRLRGSSAQAAAALLAHHRREAQLVPAYVTSVERWLDGGAVAVGPLRIR
jgi:protein-tyrosine phosphatase